MITLACLTLTAACSSIPRRLTSPQVELVQLQLVQASFEGQRFDVSIMLSNPNAVAIPVRLVEFDVRLGGEGLLEGQSAAPFTLPANGSYSVDLEVFSNLVSSVSRLMSFAQGPSNALDYELRGRLTLDVAMREPLAFYRRGQVPLQLMP
jgi:LEA14-like dessication related protein